MSAQFERSDVYIGGEWRPANGARTVEVINPATEEAIGSFTQASVGDVDAAVEAAAGAGSGWAGLTAGKRGDHLERLRTELASRRDELADMVVAEVGAPVRIAQRVHVDTPLMVMASAIEALRSAERVETVGNSRIDRVPYGVVAAITPWNYPLHQAIVKVVPAMAAGCTVVLKPASLAPLTVFMLADAVAAAGIPAGVFNLVAGDGAVVGGSLVSHPHVQMVSFTGSTEAGIDVATRAAAGLRPVSLELGGKSANLLLPDADLATAVKVGVANAFLNAGQTCSALSRMLIPDSIYEDALALIAQVIAGYTMGDPTRADTRIGPVISESQREHIRGMIRQGIEDGARLIAGGADQPEGFDRGYFVRPTVLADVDPLSMVAQEEIFGPVLSVIRYSTIDEAVQIANSTQYGLSGGVWGADEAQAISVAQRLRTGQVDINGAPFNPAAPWGGFGQSGYGRELGGYGIDEFSAPRSIQLPPVVA